MKVDKVIHNIIGNKEKINKDDISKNDINSIAQGGMSNMQNNMEKGHTFLRRDYKKI